MELALGIGREVCEGYLYFCFYREQRFGVASFHGVGGLESLKLDTFQGSSVPVEPSTQFVKGEES